MVTITYKSKSLKAKWFTVTIYEHRIGCEAACNIIIIIIILYYSSSSGMVCKLSKYVAVIE